MKKISPLRRLALLISSVTVLVALVLFTAGDLYVHHPEDWLAAHRTPLTRVLEHFGDYAALLTDALGWTGRDAVNTPDDPPPTGQVTFAGDPRRTGAPAPADIVTLDRGEFRIGWSPSLRHPVWAAYHVPRDAAFDSVKRPNFQQDRSAKNAPKPRDYEARSADGTSDPTALRYDRGHLVPNHAIVTRFGPEVQRKTFLMSNIAPQTVGLNRGPWRELERYITDLWTAKYGEIWVVVGTIPAQPPRTFRPATDNNSGAIDVPEHYYMVIASQTEDSVRVLALLFDQTMDKSTFPRRHIVSVDELERRTGLDFFPNLEPKSLETALEADVPTRLWPIRVLDVLKLVLVRCS